MNVTDNIKALCKINNMPICNLEMDLGRAKGYISHVKDGIRLREINQICKTFNVSINDLLEIERLAIPLALADG